MGLLSRVLGKTGANDIESQIVKDLNKQGYHVIPEFLSAAECERARAEFDSLLVECADKIQHEEAEGTSGDYRLWRVENRIAELAPVAKHPLIHGAATAYLRKSAVTHAIMMNKVVFRPGKATNSGGGWHRDSSNQQVKALVYLSDVGPDNAPFTFIPRSRASALQSRAGAKSTRFDDETIDAFVKRSGIQPIEMTGAAGTCIIADTSNVHRGKDIAAGVRYCATNYIKEDSPTAWEKSNQAWGRYFLDAK